MADPLQTIGDRIELLRERRGLSMAALAASAGIGRGTVSSLIARLKADPSANYEKKTLEGIARAGGVPMSWLEHGEGDPGWEESSAVARADAPPTTVPSPRVVYDPASPVPPDERDSPLERALLEAIDKGKHILADVDGVRYALRESHQHQRLDGDLVAAARVWLDAAAHLRKQGIPVTAGTIFPLVTLGIKTTPQQRAAAESADDLTTAESRARAAANGFTFNAESAAKLRAAQATRRKRLGGDE